MKRLATLQTVYSLHKKVLGGKIYPQYTDEEVALHAQALTIENCIADYSRLDTRLNDIHRFIRHVDTTNADVYQQIIADTWRWILDMRPQLPVSIKQK